MKTLLALFGLAICVAVLTAFVRRDRAWLKGPARRVHGTVVAHHMSLTRRGVPTYAPVYRFEDEGLREVRDEISRTARLPPIGTIIELRYPVGQPDLARPARPFANAALYGVLLAMIAVLILVVAGVIKR